MSSYTCFILLYINRRVTKAKTTRSMLGSVTQPHSATTAPLCLSLLLYWRDEHCSTWIFSSRCLTVLITGDYTDQRSWIVFTLWWPICPRGQLEPHHNDAAGPFHRRVQGLRPVHVPLVEKTYQAITFSTSLCKLLIGDWLIVALLSSVFHLLKEKLQPY